MSNRTISSDRTECPIPFQAHASISPPIGHPPAKRWDRPSMHDALDHTLPSSLPALHADAANDPVFVRASGSCTPSTFAAHALAACHIAPILCTGESSFCPGESSYGSFASSMSSVRRTGSFLSCASTAQWRSAILEVSALWISRVHRITRPSSSCVGASVRAGSAHIAANHGCGFGATDIGATGNGDGSTAVSATPRR
jgi:hypothetical protein